MVGLLVACGSTSNGRSGEQTVVHGSLAALRANPPADIAVAPVRNQTGRDDVPLELFRQAVAETLVERLYSPLALDYVDGNWVDSSFRGTPAPDALLVVAITAWDPSHLYSSGIVKAAGDLILFEGGDTTGTALWALSIERSLDLGDGRGAPPAPSERLIPEATRRFAREALALLPERDAVAAHL